MSDGIKNILALSFSGILLGALWVPKTLGVSSIPSSNQPVVVAVIDTGADLTHPELKDYLWTNPREFQNGEDEDLNGYKDDLHGWDFSTNSGEITDTNGHGTHVAGLVKQAFLEERTSEVALQLMILKYTKSDGSNSKASFLKAIRYAIDNSANIINISASGRGFSKKEYDLLKKAEAKGIQVVVATGNKRPGTKDARTFPASYTLRNIHPVAAVDSKGNVLPSCNMIKKSNVLFARGKDIRSLLPGNSYGLKTGTSQATALVSGRLAATIADRFTAPTSAQIVVMNPTRTLNN